MARATRGLVPLVASYEDKSLLLDGHVDHHLFLGSALGDLGDSWCQTNTSILSISSIQCQGKIKEIAKAHGYDQLDLYKGNQAHVANKSPRLS